MTTERIKEIQSKTAYPESASVQQALLQVWNEVEQEQLRLHIVSQQRELLIGLLTKLENGGGSAFIDKEQIVDDYLKANF